MGRPVSGYPERRLCSQLGPRLAQYRALVLEPFPGAADHNASSHVQPDHIATTGRAGRFVAESSGQVHGEPRVECRFDPAETLLVVGNPLRRKQGAKRTGQMVKRSNFHVQAPPFLVGQGRHRPSATKNPAGLPIERVRGLLLVTGRGAVSHCHRRIVRTRHQRCQQTSHPFTLQGLGSSLPSTRAAGLGGHAQAGEVLITGMGRFGRGQPIAQAGHPLAGWGQQTDQPVQLTDHSGQSIPRHAVAGRGQYRAQPRRRRPAGYVAV